MGSVAVMATGLMLNRLTSDEFTPLLAPSDIVNLRESELLPRNYPFYSMGEATAFIHSHGVMHGDIHNRNILYSPSYGRCKFLDPVGLPRLDTPDPRQMAADFVAPFADFDRDQFIAFLAGYTKSAYIYIEPIHANYIAELLGVLGASSPVLSKPHPPRIDIEALKTQAGLRFEIRNHEPIVSGLTADSIAEVLRLNRDMAFAFLSALLVLGFDFGNAAPSKPHSFLEPEPLVAIIMNFVNRKRFSSYHHYDSPYLDVPIQMLRELQGSAVYSQRQEPPSNVFFTIIARLIRHLEQPSSVNEYLDCLADVTTYFAKYLGSKTSGPDRQNKVLCCVFLQFSYMILQYSFRDLILDETKYLRVRASEELLVWPGDLIITDNSAALLAIAYSKAKANSALEVFVNSTNSASPMYSFAWEAIHTYRKLYSSLHDYVSQGGVSLSIDWLRRALLSAARSYRSSLGAYIASVSLEGAYQAGVLGPIRQEFEYATGVTQVIQRGGEIPANLFEKAQRINNA